MLTLVQLHNPDYLEKSARDELAATGGTGWGEGAATLMGLAPGSVIDTDVFVDLYIRFLDPRSDPALPLERRATP